MNISNRQTTSKKIPEIDSLYVYKTFRKGIKFSRHLNRGTGYRYTQSKAIIKAGEDEIYDYHRTAKIDGVEHGLVLVTKNGSFREVQKWFTEQVKAIEKDYNLLSNFKSAKHTPTELGIKYLY